MPWGRPPPWHTCWLVAVLGAAIAMMSTAARAEKPIPDDPAQLRAEADLLFKRILVSPNDLDAAFRFSEIETRLGDDEAAIGALERMLFYNSNLPRVRLELGLLYFHLGSYEMARSYFESAVAGANTPAEVRARVATFLAEIDRRLAANQFAFFAQTGLRHQTNADAGPDSDLIHVIGQDATIASQFRKRPDWNWFVSASLHHAYDLGNQRGDVWESDVTAYYARQFQVEDLNLGLIEASTGPRFGLGQGFGLSLHPYVLGNGVSLADRPYFGTLGGGVSLRYVTGFGVTLEPDAEFRARGFSNSTPYPNARDQEGDQAIAALGASGALPVQGLGWQGRLSYTNDTARYHPYAYEQWGIELALPYQFATPITPGRTWTLAPFASVYDVSYATPDPIVDPNIKRHDQVYRVGGTLDTQLWRNFGFALTVEYDLTHSTVINYRTKDFVVSGGPTVRF